MKHIATKILDYILTKIGKILKETAGLMWFITYRTLRLSIRICYNMALIIVPIAAISHGYRPIEEYVGQSLVKAKIHLVDKLAKDYGYVLPVSIPLETRNTYIVREAKVNSINADILRCLIHVESRNVPTAISTSSARGLGQIMYEHKKYCGFSTEKDFFNEELNIACAARLLRESIDAQGGLFRGLQGYNSSPKNIGKSVQNQEYPHKILNCLIGKTGEQ